MCRYILNVLGALIFSNWVNTVFVFQVYTHFVL